MTNYLLPFQRVKTDLPWAERLQDWIERFVAVIRRNPLIDGVFLENTPVPTSMMQVRHDLGRVPKGMIFCGTSESPSADVGVLGQGLFMIANNPGYPATETHAWVVARFYSAGFTVNIWVF